MPTQKTRPESCLPVGRGEVKGCTITAISDTHGRVHLPDLLHGHESDLLVHCGDFTSGPVDFIERDRLCQSHRESWRELVRALERVRGQFKWVVAVPGNHDQICEARPERCIREMKDIGVHLLINDGVRLGGELSVWGMPHTTPFGPWFFQGHTMESYTSRIPEDTEILVTHGPPHGILDTVRQPGMVSAAARGDHLGSPSLRQRCLDLPLLQAVFFGHIHSGHGEHRENGTLYCNCSILDERYIPAYPPTRVDWG